MVDEVGRRGEGEEEKARRKKGNSRVRKDEGRDESREEEVKR